MENGNDAIIMDIGKVYLNGLPITLSKPEIPTIKIETNKNNYSEHVKSFLEKTIDITYWTPR